MYRTKRTPHPPCRLLLSALFIFATTVSAAFQTAVITLVFPSGARSLGMGEVGTALADDESVLFFNPAGLGFRNERWTGAAVRSFYETLLPTLDLPELWHMHLAVCTQAPFDYIGGFAADFNYINFGANTLNDEEGQTLARFRSSERVESIGWGFNFAELGITNHAWGLTFKRFVSALAPGIGPGNEGTAASFAFDAGYLYKFLDHFQFGFTTMNMGPPIFYISEEEKDPIPFTMNLALAYKGEFDIESVRFFQVCAEIRLAREIATARAYGDPDPFYKAIFTDVGRKNFKENLSETNILLGGEETLVNTISVREGFLFDYIGQRYEFHWGFGLKLFDHGQLDMYSISSREGFFAPIIQHFVSDTTDDHRHGSWGVRDWQTGISFSFFKLGEWIQHDLAWWEKRPMH